jgi:hypothetical protein
LIEDNLASSTPKSVNWMNVFFLPPLLSPRAHEIFITLCTLLRMDESKINNNTNRYKINVEAHELNNRSPSQEKEENFQFRFNLWFSIILNWNSFTSISLLSPTAHSHRNMPTDCWWFGSFAIQPFFYYDLYFILLFQAFERDCCLATQHKTKISHNRVRKLRVADDFFQLTCIMKSGSWDQSIENTEKM